MLAERIIRMARQQFLSTALPPRLPHDGAATPLRLLVPSWTGLLNFATSEIYAFSIIGMLVKSEWCPRPSIPSPPYTRVVCFQLRCPDLFQDLTALCGRDIKCADMNGIVTTAFMIGLGLPLRTFGTINGPWATAGYLLEEGVLTNQTRRRLACLVAGVQSPLSPLAQPLLDYVRGHDYRTLIETLSSLIETIVRAESIGGWHKMFPITIDENRMDLLIHHLYAHDPQTAIA